MISQRGTFEKVRCLLWSFSAALLLCVSLWLPVPVSAEETGEELTAEETGEAGNQRVDYSPGKILIYWQAGEESGDAVITDGEDIRPVDIAGNAGDEFTVTLAYQQYEVNEPEKMIQALHGFAAEGLADHWSFTAPDRLEASADAASEKAVLTGTLAEEDDGKTAVCALWAHMSREVEENMTVVALEGDSGEISDPWKGAGGESGGGGIGPWRGRALTRRGPEPRPAGAQRPMRTRCPSVRRSPTRSS